MHQFDDVAALNIVVSAYSFALNFYPLYDKLEPTIRTKNNMLVATSVGLSMAGTIYCLLIWLCTAIFGANNIK